MKQCHQYFTNKFMCKQCTRNVSAVNPELDYYEDLSYIVRPLVGIDSADGSGILNEEPMTNLDIIAGLKFASLSQAHLCKSKHSRMRNWFKALDLQKRTRRNNG